MAGGEVVLMKWPEDFVNKIICGDSLTELKKMESESMNCIITSAPYYGLRSYLSKGHPEKPKEIGLEKTFAEYLDKLFEIFMECKRILKPSGSLWINHGDSYGGVKEGKTDAKVSAYVKNSQEDLRKYLPQYEKCLLGQPWRLAIKLVDEGGLILRQDIIWCKQVYLKKENITKGSAMPSSVKDRFNVTHEHLFHFVKNKKYYFDLNSVRLKIQTMENRPMGMDREKDYPGAKRNAFAFNYRIRDAKKKKDQCPQFKASEEEIKKCKSKGIKSRERDSILVANRPPDYFGNPNGKNLPSCWLIGSEPSKIHHFAKFPEALVELPIKTTCPPEGIVLDPFSGTGTVGVVCKKNKRNFIGIELNEEYIKMAKQRIVNTHGVLF